MRSFDEMNRMFREMDRVFDQFRSAWMDEAATTGRRSPWPALETGIQMSTMGGEPASILEEEGDSYVFVMDLPGFEREDIDLTFDHGMLSVRADADAEDDSETHRALRSRRVAKRISIPKDVVVDEISASYHNGVLEVRLPIVEDDRGDDAHRIELE